MTIQSNFNDTYFLFACCSEIYGLSQYFNSHPDYDMFSFGASNPIIATSIKPVTATFINSDIILHHSDLYKK